MDSGNSGSLQSSSGGGDDELDSRCGGDSSPLSALLRQQPPSPSVPAFGGSLIYGLQELATPQMSHWSSPMPLPVGGAGASPSPSSCHGVAAASAEQAAAAPAQPAVAAAAPRGSRKRTRASRRAPTTVLTTDTSNFRAMVQEFTGIPAPPFAGASARSRFDHLFPSRAAAAASPATLPPYLLRPFAQKLHASPFPPFTAPSTSSPALANIAIAASTAAPSTTAVASRDIYHQLAASSAPSALLGIQDQSCNGSYLSFQSTPGAQLDGDAKYLAHPLFDRGVKLSAAPRLQDPADFLGLKHAMVGSEGTHLHPQNGDRGHGDDELSGLVGRASVTSTGTGGCKTTYTSGAGSAARATPLLERNAQITSTGVATATMTTAATAAMRTQGVDSWICTSE